MYTKTTNSLFYLIRQGVGHRAAAPFVAGDWQELKELAVRQGVSAVVLDGVGRLPKGQGPEEGLLQEWRQEVRDGFEARYSDYCKVLAQMSKFLSSKGIRMMVLKGYACALDWPRPEHRPCGDIDLWAFGRAQEVEDAVIEGRGIDVTTDRHHYSSFRWWKFLVDNHYTLINTYHHKANLAFEQILEKLAEDDSHSVDLAGERIYLPSPDLHALFLLKHSFSHFVAGDLSLRQVLDWGFHVQAHSSEIDLPRLVEVLDRFGMHRMFNLFNIICVEDLGFAASLFPELRFSPVLKDRVLFEILSSSGAGDAPARFFPRLVFRFRRWRASTWKHRLCYRESLWSAFWSRAWGHLLKSSSI